MYKHLFFFEPILCVFVYILGYLFILFVFVVPYVCIAVLTLVAGLLARSQYPEGPATGYLDTGFSWFPCVYKRMLRWFSSFQVATTSLRGSSPLCVIVISNIKKISGGYVKTQHFIMV